MTDEKPIDSRYCPFIKSDGEQCGNWAGKGTPHSGFGFCSSHSGNSLPLIKHAAKLEMASLVGELDVEPGEALLSTVRKAAYAVEGAGAIVAKLEEEVAAGEGSEKSLRAWNQIYGDGLDRVARLCKMALDAGVAQRRLELEELQITQFYTATKAILLKLNLSPEQKAIAAPAIMEQMKALSEVQQGAVVDE
jgi:hypothetical protein